MPNEIVDYRIKPARGYGMTGRVLLSVSLMTTYTGMGKKPHLKMEYDGLMVRVENPQRLSFNLNHVLSTIRTIHGRELSMELVNNEQKN